AIGTPELAGPMFGDASRSVAPSTSRTRWPLYSLLVEATELFGDPKYAARAKLDASALPEQTCYAFTEAGMYVMRDRWGPEQIYFALHCSPKGISGHDQPDNGTFELCAFGRWLMPDSGFYTYGHDPAGRRWHRQTRVHQTLTLDGKDSQIAGRHLGWRETPEYLVATVENDSYPGLVHRRTVWFVDRRFFVLLDEAIGNAQGTLELRFQLAPGGAEINAAEHWATTALEDANVLVWAPPEAPISMYEEEGWYACRYGHREPRKAVCYRHGQGAPAAFLTVVVPYRGGERPKVAAAIADGYEVGSDRAEVSVELGSGKWRLRRTLND
ncbi:MAG: heparinase II/III-family protein, partial [Sedimentisphaerales bacterium]|nr:heparinase II/III-family protein [Sedimentisphaerales bacterium]